MLKMLVNRCHVALNSLETLEERNLLAKDAQKLEAAILCGYIKVFFKL